MPTEAEEYHLMVRLAAYAGSSLRFAVLGIVDGEAVIIAETHLHHLPYGKTLKETADHLHEILLGQLMRQHDLPEGIEWVQVVHPGICLN